MKKKAVQNGYENASTASTATNNDENGKPEKERRKINKKQR